MTMACRLPWRSLFRSKCDRIISNNRTIHGISVNSLEKNEKFSGNEKNNSYGISRSLLGIGYNLDCTSRRLKYGKSKKGDKQNEEDEDEEDERNEELEADVGKNAKIINPNTPSMRIDAIVKSGFGIARNKAEVALYESRIRVNGEKLLKKATNANIDDVIDVIIGPSPKNPKFTLINRITILDAKSSVDHIKLKLLREKNLVVDDYANSYKVSSDD